MSAANRSVPGLLSLMGQGYDPEMEPGRDRFWYAKRFHKAFPEPTNYPPPTLVPERTGPLFNPNARLDPSQARVIRPSTLWDLISGNTRGF